MHISPLKKNIRHPTASTCCVCWTAVIGNNSFSKMYVRAGRFVSCYRAHYVMKVWFCVPNKGASYANASVIYSRYVVYVWVNRPLYAYINACIHTRSRTGNCCTYCARGMATGLGRRWTSLSVSCLLSFHLKRGLCWTSGRCLSVTWPFMAGL